MPTFTDNHFWGWTYLSISRTYIMYSDSHFTPGMLLVMFPGLQFDIFYYLHDKSPGLKNTGRSHLKKEINFTWNKSEMEFWKGFCIFTLPHWRCWWLRIWNVPRREWHTWPDTQAWKYSFFSAAALLSIWKGKQWFIKIIQLWVLNKLAFHFELSLIFLSNPGLMTAR